MSVERLCAVIGDRLLTDIRQHVLVGAAAAVYPDCAPETRNRMALTPAAAVLHYAAENDLCPYIRVRKFKERRPQPRSMRKEDADRLIDAADGQMKLLLVFLFSQGWRISDALRLAWQDIDLKEASVRHHIRKTDEWLIMPLHLTVVGMLGKVRKDVGRVFPWGHRSNLYRELRPLCASVGVGFTPHRARHSFATWLANDGVSTKDIMEAGGWRDPKSVMRYTRIDERRVRETVNRIRT